MSLRSVFAPLFFSVFPNPDQHLARSCGLTGTLAHTEGVGLVSEKKPKQMPVTRLPQCWEPRD